MPRTPDYFPGQRVEDDLRLVVTGGLPSQSGQILYVTGSASGSGFFFNEEGTVRSLGMSSTTHEAEYTLAHTVVSSTYDQVTYDAYSRLSTTITWADATMTRKVQQCDVEYSGTSSLVQAVTSSQYTSTGVLSYRVFEVPVYDSSFRIVALTRTRA